MVQLFNDDFLLASCIMFDFSSRFPGCPELFSLFSLTLAHILPIPMHATGPCSLSNDVFLMLVFACRNMPPLSFTIFPVSYLPTIFTLHGASVAYQ